MEKNTQNQGQTDSDILRCRADIVRAREAIRIAKTEETAETSPAKTEVKADTKDSAKLDDEIQTKPKPKADPKAESNRESKLPAELKAVAVDEVNALIAAFKAETQAKA